MGSCTIGPPETQLADNYEKETIIISDLSAHRIQVFSKEGNFIQTIGERGQQPGMLYLPTGIALTEQLNLVVMSRNDNFTLQIFSCSQLCLLAIKPTLR